MNSDFNLGFFDIRGEKISWPRTQLACFYVSLNWEDHQIYFSSS